MTATFQRGDQRRTNSRFLKAVTGLALCAATVSSAGCAQDPMAGSVASTAASDLRGVASRLAPRLLRTWMLGTRARGFPAEPVVDFH